MGKFFFYNREKAIVKKDEKGVAIPLKDEFGKLIPGKFETEIVTMLDSFNVEKVIRTHMLTEDSVVVLLDDGHEESQVVDQRLKSPKKPATPENVENVKGRVWVQSEITIKGKDKVTKLYEDLANL